MAGERQICHVPDHYGVGSLCRLPDPHTTYAVMDLLPGLTEQEWLDVLVWGFKSWANVADVSGRMIETASHADLLVTASVIDVAGQVLAWMEMSCGMKIQHPYGLKTKYDTAEEEWVFKVNPGPRQIDIGGVLGHELGHFWGLPHDPDPRSLMYAMYRPGIRTPQPRDIAAMRARGYGPPVAVPVPPLPTPIPPVPVPPGGGSMSDLLKTFQTILSLASMAAKFTPNVYDDKVVSFLQKIVDSLLAGQQLSEEQIAETYRVLGMTA